ncbi:MAG TPA: metallophosphoesterase, partial [Polyangiaceae bacterium]|nr:metallophosphoesterase [Polyangiaceae bacterium]
MRIWPHFAALLVLGASCLSPAEERVELDREVGRAQAAGLAVAVDDGLATVRSLSSTALVLWGSAPGFAWSVTANEPTELELEIQNCLVDAELQVTAGDAQLSSLGAAETPTRQRWRLQLPAGETRLELAAPDAGSLEPFDFALLSDIQEAVDHVADVFDKLNAQTGLRFLLGAGDLTQRGTREELERFQRELLRLQIPYFTTLGNHELGTHPDLFHEYFGRGSFQFRFHGVAFTLLDDASATLDPTTYDWLEGWL